MKHLSEKECIALMLDLSGGRNRDRIRKHLETCDKCKKQYSALLPVIKPYIAGKVNLPGKLKKRILGSAVQVRNSGITSGFGYKIKLLWENGAGFYASIVFCALILVLCGIFLFPEISPSKVNLQIARVYGEADIDSVPAEHFDSVGSGNTISTDKDSSMILSFLRDYKIILMGKSKLTIDKARLFKNKNLEVKYSLSKGTLLNRNNRDTSVRYIFSTPHALIKSHDADLMLQASNNASNILLIKGRLVVQDKNSSSKITIESPGKYIITDNDGIKMIKAVDPTEEELKKIQEALDSNNYDDILASRYNFQPSDENQKSCDGDNETYEKVTRPDESGLK